MKSARFWKQIALTLHRLSPGTIRKDARRPFSLAIVGNPLELQHWMTALVPPELAEPQRGEAMKRLFTIPVPVSKGYADMLPRFDVVLATPSAGQDVRQFTQAYFPVPSVPDPRGDWARPVAEILWDQRPELPVPLSRHYPVLREATIEEIIRTVSKENAAFAILSALPNVIPSPIALPWAIGEFASDTALITTNQFRMAFLIAAASDAPVGWAQQKGQIASIAGSAFGLRAFARELAGKLPAGGGLVTKGLIAFAATWAMGRGLQQYHLFGKRFTSGERGEAYRQALKEGRKLIEDMTRRMTGGPRATPA